MAKQARRSGKRIAKPARGGKKVAPKEPKVAKGGKKGPGRFIVAWIDDPMQGDLVKVPVPNLSDPPFAMKIEGYSKQPPVGEHQTDSEAFRYWNAAEALRR